MYWIDTVNVRNIYQQNLVKGRFHINLTKTMLKSVSYFMTKRLGNETILELNVTLYFEKGFSIEHTKNPNAYVQALQYILHFWRCGIVPPNPNALFTYNMENMRKHLPAKGLVGTHGEENNDIFFIFSYMFNMKNDHFSPPPPPIKLYIN